MVLLLRKRMRLSLLLILVMQAPLYSTVHHTTGCAATEQEQTSLELTTSIVNQRYCQSSDEGGYNTLRMDLRLRYKNTGRQPVILYKGSRVVYREMVSRTALDAARRSYIFDLSLMVGVEGTLNISDSPVLNKDFVVLLPGAIFETVAHEGSVLFLKRNDPENSSDALSTGEYMLQVSTYTFPYSQKLAENLRSRWKTIGVLWSNDLTSRPMAFTVERDRKLSRCNP